MLMLIALLAGALSLIEPQQPVGKWKVDYNPTNCTISREYGDPQYTTTLAFQPEPSGFEGDIFLLLPEVKAKQSQGIGTVSLLPSGTKFRAEWVSGLLPGNRHIVRFRVDDAFWSALPDALAIRIDSKNEQIALALTSVDKVLVAAKTCGDNLLRQWGADPAALIPPSSKPMFVNWVTTNDYPVAALHANQEGDVRLLMSIAADGNPIECKVVVTSGVAALDNVTCSAMMKRARFPVGQPAIRFLYRVVKWRLPG